VIGLLRKIALAGIRVRRMSNFEYRMSRIAERRGLLGAAVIVAAAIRSSRILSAALFDIRHSTFDIPGCPVSPSGPRAHEGLPRRTRLAGLLGLSMMLSLTAQLLSVGSVDAAAYDSAAESVTISGKILDDGSKGLSGVQMEFSPGLPGGGGQTVVTGSDGTYSVKVRKGWTGRARPKAAVCTVYAPASRSYTSISADQSNQDYQSGYRMVVISGRVTDSLGKGIPGVTMSGLTAFTGTSYVTVTTGPDGSYRHTVMCGFSLPAVKPVKPNHVFSPVSRNYTTVTADMVNQDYQGSGQPR